MTKKETIQEMSGLVLNLQLKLDKGDYQNIQLRLLITKINEDIIFMSRYKLSEKVCVLILSEVQKKIEDLTIIKDS